MVHVCLIKAPYIPVCMCIKRGLLCLKKSTTMLRIMLQGLFSIEVVHVPGSKGHDTPCTVPGSKGHDTPCTNKQIQGQYNHSA